MLQIEVAGGEFFDEEKEEFYVTKPQKLLLEHSLLSISKWEAKWKKPFLSEKELTPEEFKDYVRCMTITSNVDLLVYEMLTTKDLLTIKNYIQDPMTATTIKSNRPEPKRGRYVTSELIYYWMTAQNIPIDCEKWHLNRLMTLIRVANIENNPKKKKMSQREIHSQNAALNAARRAKYHTKG